MSTTDQDTSTALDTSNANQQASDQENEQQSDVSHNTAQFPQNQQNTNQYGRNPSYNNNRNQQYSNQGHRQNNHGGYQNQNRQTNDNDVIFEQRPHNPNNNNYNNNTQRRSNYNKNYNNNYDNNNNYSSNNQRYSSHAQYIQYPDHNQQYSRQSNQQQNNQQYSQQQSYSQGQGNRYDRQQQQQYPNQYQNQQQYQNQPQNDNQQQPPLIKLRLLQQRSSGGGGNSNNNNRYNNNRYNSNNNKNNNNNNINNNSDYSTHSNSSSQNQFITPNQTLHELPLCLHASNPQFIHGYPQLADYPSNPVAFRQETLIKLYNLELAHQNQLPDTQSRQSNDHSQNQPTEVKNDTQRSLGLHTTLTTYHLPTSSQVSPVTVRPNDKRPVVSPFHPDAVPFSTPLVPSILPSTSSHSKTNLPDVATTPDGKTAHAVLSSRGFSQHMQDLFNSPTDSDTMTPMSDGDVQSKIDEHSATMQDAEVSPTYSIPPSVSPSFILPPPLDKHENDLLLQSWELITQQYCNPAQLCLHRPQFKKKFGSYFNINPTSVTQIYIAKFDLKYKTCKHYFNLLQDFNNQSGNSTNVQDQDQAFTISEQNNTRRVPAPPVAQSHPLLSTTLPLPSPTSSTTSPCLDSLDLDSTDIGFIDTTVFSVISPFNAPIFADASPLPSTPPTPAFSHYLSSINESTPLSSFYENYFISPPPTFTSPLPTNPTTPGTSNDVLATAMATQNRLSTELGISSPNSIVQSPTSTSPSQNSFSALFPYDINRGFGNAPATPTPSILSIARHHNALSSLSTPQIGTPSTSTTAFPCSKGVTNSNSNSNDAKPIFSTALAKLYPNRTISTNPFHLAYFPFLPVQVLIQLNGLKAVSISDYLSAIWDHSVSLLTLEYDKVVPWSANNLNTLQLLDQRQRIEADKIAFLKHEEAHIARLRRRLKEAPAQGESQPGSSTLEGSENDPYAMNDLSDSTSNFSSSEDKDDQCDSEMNNEDDSKAIRETPAIDSVNTLQLDANSTSKSNDQTQTSSLQIHNQNDRSINHYNTHSRTHTRDADSNLCPRPFQLSPTDQNALFMTIKSLSFKPRPLATLLGHITSEGSSISAVDTTSGGIAFKDEYTNKTTFDIMDYVSKYDLLNPPVITIQNTFHSRRKRTSAPKLCRPDEPLVSFVDLAVAQFPSSVEWTPPYWFIVFLKDLNQYILEILACYNAYLLKNSIKAGSVHPEVAAFLKTSPFSTIQIENQLSYSYRGVFLGYISGRKTVQYSGGGDIALEYGEMACEMSNPPQQLLVQMESTQTQQGEVKAESYEEIVTTFRYDLNLQFELLKALMRSRKFYELWYFYERFTNPKLYPKTAAILKRDIDFATHLPKFAQVYPNPDEYTKPELSWELSQSQRCLRGFQGSTTQSIPRNFHTMFYRYMAQPQNKSLSIEHGMQQFSRLYGQFPRPGNFVASNANKRFFRMPSFDLIQYISTDYQLISVFIYVYYVLTLRGIPTPYMSHIFPHLQIFLNEYLSNTPNTTSFHVEFHPAFTHDRPPCDALAGLSKITNHFHTFDHSDFFSPSQIAETASTPLPTPPPSTSFTPTARLKKEAATDKLLSEFPELRIINDTPIIPPSLSTAFLPAELPPISANARIATRLQSLQNSTQGTELESVISQIPPNVDPYRSPQFSQLLDQYEAKLKTFGLCCEHLTTWTIPVLPDFMVVGYDTEFSSFSLPSLPLTPSPKRPTSLLQISFADFSFVIPYWLISTPTYHPANNSVLPVTDSRYNPLAPEHTEHHLQRNFYASNWSPDHTSPIDFTNLNIDNSNNNQNKYQTSTLTPISTPTHPCRSLVLPYVDRLLIVSSIMQTLFYTPELIISGINVEEDVSLTEASIQTILNLVCDDLGKELYQMVMDKAGGKMKQDNDSAQRISTMTDSTVAKKSPSTTLYSTSKILTPAYRQQFDRLIEQCLGIYLYPLQGHSGDKSDKRMTARVEIDAQPSSPNNSPDTSAKPDAFQPTCSTVHRNPLETFISRQLHKILGMQQRATSILDFNHTLFSWGALLLSTHTDLVEKNKSKSVVVEGVSKDDITAVFDNSFQLPHSSSSSSSSSAPQGPQTTSKQSKNDSNAAKANSNAFEAEKIAENNPLYDKLLQKYPILTPSAISSDLCPQKQPTRRSLAKWVEMTFDGFTLFKDPITCSNWDKFPLTTAQLHYAGLDAYIALCVLQESYGRCIVVENLHHPITSRRILLNSLTYNHAAAVFSSSSDQAPSGSGNSTRSIDLLGYDRSNQQQTRQNQVFGRLMDLPTNIPPEGSIIAE